MADAERRQPAFNLLSDQQLAGIFYVALSEGEPSGTHSATSKASSLPSNQQLAFSSQPLAESYQLKASELLNSSFDIGALSFGINDDSPFDLSHLSLGDSFDINENRPFAKSNTLPACLIPDSLYISRRNTG